MTAAQGCGQHRQSAASGAGAQAALGVSPHGRNQKPQEKSLAAQCICTDGAQQDGRDGSLFRPLLSERLGFLDTGPWQTNISLGLRQYKFFCEWALMPLGLTSA